MKVGDRVRFKDNLWSECPEGAQGTVKAIHGGDGVGVVSDEGGDTAWYCRRRDLELVNKSEVKMRKIYRLKKDSLDIDRGTLFIEMCDDGDQDFVEYDVHRAETGSKIVERSKVTDRPEWFEEVEIKVEPKIAKKTTSKPSQKRRKKHPSIRKDVVAARRRQARRMYLDGKSVKAIERELKVSNPTVSRYLNGVRR